MRDFIHSSVFVQILSVWVLWKALPTHTGVFRAPIPELKYCVYILCEVQECLQK